MPTYATGRIDPPDLARKQRESWDQYHQHIRSLPRVTAPTWDCRQLGIVGPIKDQGQCGSCWDFSGTGIVEMAMVKAGLGPPESFQLSEQYILDCARNGGCSGDDNSSVCEWAKSTGLPLKSEYPGYEARRDRCRSGSMKLYKITDWGYCSGDQGVADTQAIKDMMVAHGPIGAAIAANSSFMNVRPGEVFRGSSSDINHDIILVGWDDSKGSKGAWLLRNSWGTSWCDGGYCWIEYGANSVGYAALWVTLPPVNLNWLI